MLNIVVAIEYSQKFENYCFRNSDTEPFNAESYSKFLDEAIEYFSQSQSQNSKNSQTNSQCRQSLKMSQNQGSQRQSSKGSQSQKYDSKLDSESTSVDEDTEDSDVTNLPAKKTIGNKQR